MLGKNDQDTFLIIFLVAGTTIFFIMHVAEVVPFSPFTKIGQVAM